MRYILLILLTTALVWSVPGCSGEVVYDNEFSDTFRYKPESEWDYVRYLGPQESEQMPTINTLEQKF